MMRGNDRCPCGSGLKFKRCCRSKDRPPETCHFCGKKEPEVKGEYAVLVNKDGTEDKEQIFACMACIEKQRPGGDASANGLLPLMVMAAGTWGFRVPRAPRKRR
jgi:hypothetical protein